MGRDQHYCRRVTRGGSSRLKILERVSVPDQMNADPDYGVDDFRTKNLVAILRAVPQTDGTCSAVASKASALRNCLRVGPDPTPLQARKRSCDVG